MAKSGRDYEKTIDTDYLLSIQSGYFQFFKEYPELYVLLLDVDDMDYVNDEKVYNKLVDLICHDYPKGISCINLKSLLE
ncbi:MAG: deoxynucleoside kinase [Marinilabiliaceae bacterium]|nr:deoxynucleoside kinase [Marinilabiliaceae bacterium]